MVLFTLTVFDFWLDIVGPLTKKLKMENIKSEPVDFVKEFQEYLTQQTQHVNMISGSVCGEKDPDDSFHAVTTGNVGEYRGADPPSVEVSLALEDGAELQMDGLERTLDGKYKCSYCNYANKGMARLIEHIRIHTGEKPHRCQLCPFASAYERHLEAHMRSHTGEKPYKCDLCAFRCSDRSNLSHHRRRRHKLLPVRGVRSPFSNKRMLSVLQKRTSSLGFGRRLLLNLSPPSMVPPKPDHLSDLSRDLHHHLNNNEYKNSAKVHERDSSIRSANGLTVDNPLDQLSALAGQLANLPPHPQSPGSPDRLSSEDEKPILVQQASGPPVALSTNGVQTMPLKDPCPSVHSDEAAPASTTQDQLLSHKCQHCDIQFSDNILYTIHMGCHGYEHPFQCNICGCICRDKYDFACHFARGHLKK